MRNRFNGFYPLRKTVETVRRPSSAATTPLKRGVNEIGNPAPSRDMKICGLDRSTVIPQNASRKIAMKRKSLNSLAVVACLLTAISTYAYMPPEDKIGKKYWESLDAKAKPVFLMGFRHGTGPELKGPPPGYVNEEKTKRGSLVFHAEQFPKLIEKVDAFYKVKENERVCIRYAVEVSLMEISGKPKEEIDNFLKVARSLAGTAY